tara:strand:- start:345 stop:1553 length:1209 start_codon:yes stop_codon:yes gene_type:complete
VGESVNSKKTIKQIRRGLSIYRTGRSPFWHARIYDQVKKKYVVRSTKETKRLDAIEVAEEILESYKSKQNSAHATSMNRSFEYYGKLLADLNDQKSKQPRNKYTKRDQNKILYQENEGLISYFGKYDVSKITSGMVREYLLFLDKKRDEPLALSTKSKRCGVIRQVLMLALEDGVIDIIPPMPKQRTVDAPRVSFTETEYKLLLKTAREIADAGETVVRGVLVTREHYHVIAFAVQSFLRPAETELFGIRFCDIEVNKDPEHLLLTLTGKTGYRKSATMPDAVGILEKIREMYPDASPTDYVFMPQYPNRTTALNTYRRIFNHFLDSASLKRDKDGNPRSPYSLRHYALQTRLRKSEGEVNIYLLAKNAGTSVEQLERFYLKNMEPSGEEIGNLHTFGKNKR